MKILIPRGVAGLGALPALPPASMLKPGMQWVRYYVKDQNGNDVPTMQARACPGTAPWGCTMYEGHAWGQVPTNDEFSNVPTRTPTTSTPTAAEIEQKCSNAYTAWKRAHPTLATCLTGADRTAFMSLCSAAWQGKLDSKTADARWSERVQNSCVNKCRASYESWRQAHPGRAACLPGNARSKYVDLCLRALHGEITGAQRDDAWSGYVSKMCKAAGKPPDGGDGGGGDGGGGGSGPGSDGPSGVDAPVPTKPVLENTPDVVESPSGLPPGSGVERGTELVDSIIKGDGMPDGGGGGGADAGQEKSLLRRIGPIVGIGLVLAVGGVAWWQHSIKKKGARGRRR